jgi:2-keto-4-pentenoate hydratase/2-oxohepta-3-ene-1,7-dioic acid hydratase in catechol pathway
VIMTGTPHGVSSLHAGDQCTVSIQGIGSLENPVRNRANSA